MVDLSNAGDDADVSTKVQEEAEDLISQTLEELSQEPVDTETSIKTTISTKASSPVKEHVKIGSPTKAVDNGNGVTIDSVADEKKVVASAKSATEALTARAARFGLPVDAAKASPTANLDSLKKRSERFGEKISDELKKEEAKEKLVERQKRFGAGDAGTKVAMTDEKLAERQKRFGVVVAEPKATKTSPAAKGKITPVTNKRPSAPMSAEDEEKLKKRRERFGVPV